MPAEYTPYVIGAVFAVMGYLLSKKDAQQEQQIRELKEALAEQKKDCEAKVEVLFKKHDIDAAALQELRVHVAEGHYKKSELDFKFEKIELAITNSFTTLGAKFDKLSDALIDHINKEDKK